MWSASDDTGSEPEMVRVTGRPFVDGSDVDELAEDDRELTEEADPVFLRSAIGTDSGVVMLSRKNLTLTKNTNECTSCSTSIEVGLKTYKQQEIMRSSGVG